MEQEANHNPKRVLSFTEHLEELRVRIIICVVFIVITFLGGFCVSSTVVGWLIRPLTNVSRNNDGHTTLTFTLTDDMGLKLDLPASQDTGTSAVAAMLARMGRDRIAIRIPGQSAPVIVGPRSTNNLFFLSPIEPFMLLVKGALLVSAVFSIPMVLYQVWLFVAPGLVRRERRIVKPILLSSVILFPMGAGFAYFVAHLALKVLIGFGDMIPGLMPSIVASKYLGFILTLMLAFGVVFEFPLVLLMLSRVGVVTSTYLAERRKYAILIMAVAAAVVTPTPDPFTMLAMLLPLLLLYEISVWLIRLMERTSDAAAVVVHEKSV